MKDRISQASRYKWRRLWIPPEDVSGVAVRGLFSEHLHTMSVRAARPEARTLEEMEDIRVLLLRGESGAGKTVALTQEVERLRAAGKHVEMADLADGLCDLPSLLQNKGGQQELTIFVDGLDVGLIRDKALDAALRRAVPTLSTSPGARLRLALRTGFAAEPLTACLATHFGEDFEHLTIAPLRPEEVRAAAISEGIDPDDFINALEGLRVAPLAARPPTLRMLLRLWARDGRLPTRRQDIYRQGCEVLLREANVIRLNEAGGDDPDYAGRLELLERFALATRLAALMTFGDYDHLSFAAEPTATGLHVDAVAGDVEFGERIGTRVTRRAVREVVGTALFRPAGQDGFAFSHPSFMQFLAATFVAERDLSPPQGLPLLTAPDGRTGANRIEVASWLGALKPAYFDHLATADPQVLLRTGIPARTSEQRLRLAKALLAFSADGSLDLHELSQTGDLVLVAANGLAATLAQILTNKSEPPARREFAILMAKDSGCVPVTACAALAMDNSEPSDLRRAALTPLVHDVKGAEKAINTLSALDEPNESLHLTALGVGMRTFLRPAEVIRRLKPGERQLGQTYLCLRLLRDILPTDLPDALEAITAIATRSKKGEKYDNHLTVAQGLAGQAFAHLDDARIQEALATFIATLPPREPWLRWSFPLHKRGLPPVSTLERRRALVSAVVTRAPGSPIAARNLLEACFLLHNDDLTWIVEETRAALGGPHAAVWSTLAEEVARGCGGAPYGHLSAEGLTFEEIAQIAREGLTLPRDFERWTPPDAWDSIAGKFVDGRDSEEDEEDQDEEEPLVRALADWKLLTIQTEAGGRPDAPPTHPDTLLALANQADRRLVRDSLDLLRVVQESLGRLHQRLKGRDPLVRALWDEGEPTRPKEENFLSDFVVDHLRSDLIIGGVVADREVQIRPRLRDTPGERTDIQVQAFTKAKSDAARQQVASLTIEVKGCWNRDLYTAMETQLMARYLSTSGDQVGLYLVGWYLCPAWSNPKIAGLAPTPEDSLPALRAALNSQAIGISNDTHHLEAAVIDVALD